VFPLFIMLASIPLYERFIRIFRSKLSGRTNIVFRPLGRIGLELALASVSMAMAAIVEAKWRREAAENNAAISIFWLGWKYLQLGVADMLTLGGMLEFFLL
jgi:peptide/histidine transporter 3/4